MALSLAVPVGVGGVAQQGKPERDHCRVGSRELETAPRND
jgi:hypothetical protein